ncbi:hypothetical protein [Burkholderia oklahomensis]|nr:hypothetical protein [Burkholderia oklahomensis]MDN7676632.1 hypothetical protein [Burkholderia oklahomensis]
MRSPLAPAAAPPPRRARLPRRPMLEKSARRAHLVDVPDNGAARER